MVNTDGSFTGPQVTNVDQYEVIIHDDWMITGVPSIFWGHLHVFCQSPIIDGFKRRCKYAINSSWDN